MPFLLVLGVFSPSPSLHISNTSKTVLKELKSTLKLIIYPENIAYYNKAAKKAPDLLKKLVAIQCQLVNTTTCAALPLYLPPSFTQ
ncbi:hypothetical protein NLX67_19540 [Domibacillus sp. A3M-37]|uniref:hypothetical protein n=1 Tax=Domibacillus sp. A3M-37 TaxID=2962037 RepID=UPI0020B6949E|nr:hypothetical protein [Domibacillus sp. A3M-37]MCP3764540.1 hypothetical protein [Domibacillus sp. A3M-37]